MTVYPSLLLLLFAVFSCSHSTVDRHLLVQPYWQLASIHTDPVLVGGPGPMDQMAHCEKDDAWKFASNGILKTFRGNDQCHPNENFTDCIGGWSLSNRGDQLTVRESGGAQMIYRLLNLSPNTLKLRFTADEAEVTLTYKSIPARLLAREN